jgi:hypothetical protein
VQAFWRGRRKVADAKEKLRQEWDEAIMRENVQTDAWNRATRLLPFFYDIRHDEQRAVHLLRWLVQSPVIVNAWMKKDPTYPYTTIRLVATLLKSVGTISIETEYRPFARVCADLKRIRFFDGRVSGTAS